MKILIMVGVALVIVGGEASVRPSRLAAQRIPSAPCPTPDSRDAAIIRKLFASDSRAAVRGRVDSTRMSSASVRPLRAETDRSVCSRLNQIFSAVEDTSLSLSYYAFDSYYIVVVRRERDPGVFSTASVPVVILDREFKAVEVLGI
jgi:hypothetical protein